MFQSPYSANIIADIALSCTDLLGLFHDFRAAAVPVRDRLPGRNLHVHIT